MKLVLRNSRAYVTKFDSEAQFLELNDLVTFETQVFSPFKKRMETHYKSLLHLGDNSFPIGVAPLVIQMLREAGHEVEVSNERVMPGGPPNLAILDDLYRTPYPFQREAIEAGLKRGIGIVKAPTGSGKTMLGVGIMATKQDINWVVFCPKDTLVKQWADEYELNLQEKVGTISSTAFKPARVTIMTFSQARSKEAKVDPILEAAGGFICDEVHSSGGPTHMVAIDKCKNAFYRIGLSATPLDRSDKKTLAVLASTGPMIYEIKTEDLMDLQLVSRPTIRMVKYTHKRGGPADNLQEHAAIYRARIVNNPERNALLLKMIRAAEKPTMAFVLRNEHVRSTYDSIDKNLLSVASVDQDAPPVKRDDVLAKMRKGTLDVCVTSSVFQDGVSVPNLASVVVGTGYASVLAAIQRIGRGSRITESKKEFELWDIADEGCYGERHTKARVAAYEREGYDVTYIDALELEDLCRD